MSDEDLRLFELGPRQRKSAVAHPEPAARHLSVVQTPAAGPQVGLAMGGKELTLVSDGLPARIVKDHSAEKSWAVSRDLDTVGRAMNRQWFPVHYLELFSGPGVLYNDHTKEETVGSPLEALLIQRPFDRYVFSDYDKTCTDALDARVRTDWIEEKLRGGSEVFVRQGDANNTAHLNTVCSLLDPDALVIAYLDPAKPNLHWSTVEYLAKRFRRLDLLINLPFSAIHRALSVGHTQGPSLMLNDPNPLRFLNSDEGRASYVIREHYRDQLRQLGFPHIAWRSVHTRTTRSPLYDVILASRNPRAVDLFEKANRVTESGQLDIF